MERAVLRIARRANEEGQHHSLLLFDTPFRSENLDFRPDPVKADYLPRGPGLDFKFVLKLAQKLDSLEINLVHAHNDTALVYAVMAKLFVKSSRIKVIGSFHSWPSHDTRRARLLNKLASYEARIVAVSDELANRLVGGGWVRNCSTVWNGVDLDCFSRCGPDADWRTRLGIPSGGLLIGHIARFDPIKRHEDMLAAACLLAKTNPEVTIVFVGQGPRLRQIQQQAADLENVRFIPNVLDISTLLRSLDVSVLCSAHEASPLAILESMACGVPVIGTRVGGIPHLLGFHGADQAGILVPAFDPECLADAISYLARNPAERDRLSRNARRRSKLFSFNAEWLAYQALYAEVIGSAGKFA